MPTLQFEAFNNAVKGWGKSTTAQLKSQAQAAGIIHRSDSPSRRSSVAQIKDKYRLRDGAVSSISFTFPRTLIFPHKGAGKGMGGSVGSRWIDRHGVAKKTNPLSLGKMGTGGRKAKPFFNSVMDAEGGMGELATIAATELGDTIVGNILIK